MSDTREIVVRIKSPKVPTSFNGNQEFTNDLKNVINFPKNIKNKILGGSVAANQLYEISTRTAKSLIDWSINRNLDLSANYVAKREINEVKTIINGTMGLLGSIGAGAISGASVGGPIGAAVGAVMGFTSNLVGGIIESEKAYDQQKIRIARTNADASFSQSRYLGTTTDFSRGTDN